MHETWYRSLHDICHLALLCHADMLRAINKLSVHY
jgi:hypothetical protein